MDTPTHICTDCTIELGYSAMVAHVRSAHGREPLSGPTIAVGDLVRRKGFNWRVVKVHPNGDYEVRPLISIEVEYRKGHWEANSYSPVEPNR